MTTKVEELQAEIVRLRRNLAEVKDKQRWMEDLLEQSTIPAALFQGPNHVFVFANERFLARAEKHDVVGKAISEVFTNPEYEIPGVIAILDEVYASGEIQIVPEAYVRLANPKTGEFEDSWFKLIFNPVRDNQGVVVGVSNFSVEVTEQVQARQEVTVFKTLVENAPDGIGIADENTHMTYTNAAFREMYGYADSMSGVNATSFYAEEDLALLPSIIESLESHGSWKGMVRHKRQNSEVFPVLLSLLSLHETGDQSKTQAAIVRDISEQEQAEQERTTLQEQVIAAQQAALRELSAPLLPISDHVVVLPLVGSIDSQRAQQVMETLLEGIAHYQSDVAIVDITGVQVIDTQVANALIQAAQAVSLLGAKVILTGIGPAMAQTLIHMGADLSSIVTRGSLRSGIAYAMEN